jgi:quercetin dioxygenase-like cupin family protein
MNPSPSSCELSSTTSQTTPAGSRVVHFQEGFRWEGVPVCEYKPGEATNWCGITRTTLIGERGEKTAFQVRYFEIAPGGFSSLERHRHEHAVLVMRGRGEVQLGDRTQAIALGDMVYVAPNEVHQFRNAASATEPLGFICIVDAVRDKPA